MQASLDISTPEQLSAMLEGKNDAEIESSIAELGTADALDRIFDSMVERYLPERAAGQHATIQWHLQTLDGPRDYQLDVAGASCRVAPGRASSPRVTLSASVPVFLRVVAGRLNGLQAFARGQLRVTGDQTLALRQQLFFDADLSQAELDISTPRELAQLIAGRSDEEVNAGTAVTGVDRTLELVFQGMVDHFLPRKAPRRRAVVEFAITTDAGERVYQLIADRRGASYRAGAGEKSNVRLSVALPNFLRMVAGKLDGIRALAQGKVKVRGNILLARGVQSWFDVGR